MNSTLTSTGHRYASSRKISIDAVDWTSGGSYLLMQLIGLVVVQKVQCLEVGIIITIVVL
jgi:hypothetical protein